MIFEELEFTDIQINQNYPTVLFSSKKDLEGVESDLAKAFQEDLKSYHYSNLTLI